MVYHRVLQLKKEMQRQIYIYLDDTSDFVSPHDFDGVEVILDDYK